MVTYTLPGQLELPFPTHPFEEAMMPKRASMSLAEPEEASNGQQLDPVIDALLSHLPAPGDPFPDRQLWMQILDLVLKLVYPEEEAGEQEHGGQT